MKLIAGTSNFRLSESIAHYLALSLMSVDIQKFADGEICIRIQEDVADEDVYVLQSLFPNINDCLVELLILSNVLKKNGAKKITAVIPYYAYARQQDSASLVVSLLTASGVDRILTLDLHNSNVGIDTLATTSLFATDIQTRFKDSVVIVSPDAGGIERARCLAQKLNVDLVTLNKVREPNVRIHKIDADVKGKNCLIVDDIVDSGATLIGAAEALKEAGAKEIHVYVTHAVLSGNAVNHIKKSKIDSMTTTDSIRSSGALTDFFILSVAEIIGQGIKAQK